MRAGILKKGRVHIEACHGSLGDPLRHISFGPSTWRCRTGRNACASALSLLPPGDTGIAVFHGPKARNPSESSPRAERCLLRATVSHGSDPIAIELIRRSQGFHDLILNGRIRRRPKQRSPSEHRERLAFMTGGQAVDDIAMRSAPKPAPWRALFRHGFVFHPARSSRK